MKYTPCERSKGTSGNVRLASLRICRIGRDTTKERYAIVMHCMQCPYVSRLQVRDLAPGDIYLLETDPHNRRHGHCTVEGSNTVKLIRIYQPHIGNEANIMKVGMSLVLSCVIVNVHMFCFSSNLIMTSMSSSDPGSVLHVCIVAY